MNTSKLIANISTIISSAAIVGGIFEHYSNVVSVVDIKRAFFYSLIIILLRIGLHFWSHQKIPLLNEENNKNPTGVINLVTLGLLLGLWGPVLIAWKWADSDKPKVSIVKIVTDTVEKKSVFPKTFDSTRLNIIITRFEDYASDLKTECYGRSIESRLDKIKSTFNLPIFFYYDEKSSPNQNDEAQKILRENNADLVLWGKLKNAKENCTAEGFCLKFNPSDTLIKCAGGKVYNAYKEVVQKNVNSEMIDDGLITIGGSQFDDWVVEMYNLKVGKKRPDLFFIDVKWPKNKKVEALISRAEIWFGLHLYENAKKDYHEAFSLRPQNDYLVFRISLCETALENKEEALTRINQAIALNGDSARYYSLRATLKSWLGYPFDKVIAEYEKSTNLDPKNPLIYNDLGVDYKLHNQFDKALIAYNKSIQLDPYFSVTYRNRAILKDAMGLYNEAVVDFTKSIELAPNDYPSYEGRASSYLDLGRYYESIIDYNKRLSLDSTESFSCYQNRGFAKATLGQHHGALLDFTKIIDQEELITPDELEVTYASRASVNTILGNYDEAINDYDYTILLNPSDQANLKKRAAVVKMRQKSRVQKTLWFLFFAGIFYFSIRFDKKSTNQKHNQLPPQIKKRKTIRKK